MRNGTVGQFGKYVRASLAGGACGAAGGALYAAVWGLTHWAVSGKGLSPAAFGPWFLAIGAALGLVAGLGWAASGRRQPQGPPQAGGLRPVPGAPGHTRGIGDTAVLRRLGG
jgi:hypothetical protein